MPKIGIGGTGNIDHIQMDEQGSNPSTPAAGKSAIFLKADGLYVIDDAGGVTGPLVSSATAVSCFARYTSNAGQTLTSGLEAIINFEDVDYDPDSAVTIGASWKFTVPAGKGGYYHVDVYILTAQTTNFNSTEVANMVLYKNGALFCELDRFTAEATGVNERLALSGSCDVDLAATDYIDVRATQSTGSNLALHTDGSYVWINIHKI